MVVHCRQQPLLLYLSNLHPLVNVHNGVHKHLCAPSFLLLRTRYIHHPLVVEHSGIHEHLCVLSMPLLKILYIHHTIVVEYTKIHQTLYLWLYYSSLD